MVDASLTVPSLWSGLAKSGTPWRENERGSDATSLVGYVQVAAGPRRRRVCCACPPSADGLGAGGAGTEARRDVEGTRPDHGPDHHQPGSRESAEGQYRCTQEGSGNDHGGADPGGQDGSQAERGHRGYRRPARRIEDPAEGHSRFAARTPRRAGRGAGGARAHGPQSATGPSGEAGGRPFVGAQRRLARRSGA